MTWRFGPFVLDGARRQLFENGVEVHLSPKAYELLSALIEQYPRVMSKAELQERLWPDTFVQEANLTVLVAEIRTALHESGRRGGGYVRTAHGFGYAFAGEVESVPPVSPAQVVAAPASFAAGRTQPRGGRLARGTIAVVIVVSALATIAWRWSARPIDTPKASLRLAIALPPDLPLAAPGRVSPAHDRPALALSRDGRWLAYVCQAGESTQLCLRDMEAGDVTRLTGTAGGHTPFFSPDGAEIGFFADLALKKTSRAGGAPVVLADAPNPWGATWGSDGVIYFNRNEGEGIHSVSASGGPVGVVVSTGVVMPERIERGLLLGGGYYARLAGGAPRRVLPGAGRVSYLGAGYLVYAVGTSLMAVSFDQERLSTRGPTLSLATDVRTATYSVAQFAMSEEGTLVYAAGTSQMRTTFTWVDRAGHRTPAGLPEGEYHAYALSPDGTRLAFGRDSGIWVHEFGAQGLPVRVSPREPAGPPALNAFPRWSPDGRRLFYMSRPAEAPARLLTVPADGSEAPVEIWRAGSDGLARLFPMTFSPDRQTLSVFGPNGADGYDIFELRANADGTITPGTPPRLVLGGPFAQAVGQVSPSGTWLLFASDATGTQEVYATSYPRPGPVHRVSVAGGREPMWNPSRPEIVYLNGTSVYGVEVRPGRHWDAGEPQMLFSGPFPDTPGFGYAMAPDGRFLMLENARFFEPTTTLHVITNVPDELRRRQDAASR